MEIIKDFIKEEDGAGVVELILIIAVLVGIVVIFQKRIKKFVSDAFNQIEKDGKTINSNTSK